MILIFQKQFFHTEEIEEDTDSDEEEIEIDFDIKKFRKNLKAGNFFDGNLNINILLFSFLI